MINRTLIRTRGIQTLYAHNHRGELSLKESLNAFDVSLERTYDLYLFLIELIPALVHKEEELVEIRKNKHLATEKEKNPNLRFVNSPLSKMIEDSLTISDWATDKGLSWQGQDAMLRRFLDTIYRTPAFDEFMQSEVNVQNDTKFFAEVFRNIIFSDDELADFLEETSIYWDNELCYIEKIESENSISNPDELDEIIQEAKANNGYNSQRLPSASVEVVKDFVLKTIKKVDNDSSIDTYLMPMYKDTEDETFGKHLLRQAIMRYDEYLPLIEKHLSSQWDKERLPDLDLSIMILAVTELIHFPNIPISVTINEYVELSKCYSTPKSGIFINAVVDAVAKELKETKKILKN